MRRRRPVTTSSNVRAVIDNRLRLAPSELSPVQQDELKALFTYDNPHWKKLKGMGRKWLPRNVPKTIASWRVGGNVISFPRGGLKKVESVVGELDLLVRWTEGAPELAGQIPKHVLTLRDYQVSLKQACVEGIGPSGCALIRSPPGSGKTTVGYAIAAELNLPTLVVVPSQKIFDQWVEGVGKNLDMNSADVGIIQGGRRIIRPLTIGMQQTLRTCAEDYADVFGCVIGDEAQKFGSATFYDVIDRLKAAWRIGVSADERRADKKEFLIYDVFGEVTEEVPRERLVAQGSIIEAEVRIVPTEFRADWYARLKPQHRMREGVQDRLANELIDDGVRNALVFKVLDRCVAEGEPTITMALRRNHCAVLNAMSLERGWNSGLLLGGAGGDRDEFRRTLGEMEDGSLMQAVGTYQAIGVGFDLPIVSRGILASPCASRDGKQQFVQFCGRFERPSEGKTKSVVYYLWDQHVHGLEAVRRIARWKTNVTVEWEGRVIRAKEFVRENY